MRTGITEAAWQRLERLFYAALELHPEERAEFLDKASDNDFELRKQVESLLAAVEKTDGFLERPVRIAAETLEWANTAAGRRFGAYEIERLIGAGGMGSVYLASRADDLYQKQVAIKFAGTRSPGDTSMLSRFSSERQILANLDHPNIARLLDGGVTAEGRPYLVMEYVQGLPIDTYCREKRLNTAKRLRLFRSVCSAIEYAHSNLVVHRDIKPANVLISNEGVPKLLDFGIAKLLNPSQAALTLTADAMMTPEYASPEQIRGEHVTTATDVYALGVLLYELLTGSRPFAAITPLALMQAICEQEPMPPSDKVGCAETGVQDTAPTDSRRTLRGDLDNIVLTAMHKEPSRRYPSVAALTRDIQAYLGGYPVVARAGNWRYKSAKFVRRHVLGVTAAAMMLLLLAGFSAIMTVERNRASREAETARRVSDFMTDMFKVPDPSVSRGNSITAREILDKASSGIVTGLNDNPEIQARLMQTMATTYNGLGLFQQSASLLERAVAVRTRIQGERNAETLDSMSSLGNAYINLGRYSDAEKLLRRTLALQQRVLGSDDQATMSTINHLAGTLTHETHYAEAEGIIRQLLAQQQRVLGADSRAALASECSLTQNLRFQGSYSEAERIGRESLARDLRVLGPDDRLTLNSMDELVFIVEAENEPAEAEKLARQELEISKHLLGPEHPDTWEVVVNIGRILQEQGRLKEAESMQRDAFEHLRKIEGPNAAATLDVMTDLATTLASENKLAEADSLSRQAVQACVRTWGTTGPYTAVAKVMLALVLARERRAAEAETLFKEAVASSAKAEGADPGNAFYYYAKGMAVLGRSDEAIEHLQQAVDHGFSFAAQLPGDEDLKPLHADPRFDSILARIRAPKLVESK